MSHTTTLITLVRHDGVKCITRTWNHEAGEEGTDDVERKLNVGDAEDHATWDREY